MNRLYIRYTSAVVAISMSLLCVANAQAQTRNAQGILRATSPTSIGNTMPVKSTIPARIGSEPELRTTYTPLVPVAPRTPKLVEMVQDDGVGTLIGTTYYDFQTNASMPNRVTYFNDGGDKYIQLLWMANADSTRDPVSRAPGFNPNRGSHYNWINVGDPDNLEAGITNWKRIESERAGWPSAVQFDDGTLGTPSHTPIRFYRNGGLTDDNWQPSASDPTTSADSAVWARAAIDGANNVHLIYNRSFPGSPNSIDQVCYRRSTSAGETWEPEVFLTGTNTPVGADNVFPGQGGDTYAIAARGDNVSVVLYSNFGLVMWRSSNNGVTWTRRTAFLAGASQIDSIVNADGSSTVHTDTVMGPLNSMDVIIDPQGVTHFTVAACPQYFEYNYAAGTGQRSNTIFLLNGTRTDQSDMQYTRLVYGNSFDTNYVFFMGPAGGGSWDGNGYVVNQRPYEGGSRWPQLGIDNAGTIYCLYSSMKNGDVKTVMTDTTGQYTNTEPDTLVSLEGLQMHVYGTQMYKPTNGYAFPDILWSAPKDLSPTGVNSQYATLCDDVADGRLYYAYSSSASPGDRVTNTEMPAEIANVYARALATSELNIPILDVADEHVLQADVALAPNPSDDASRITVSGVTNGAILVSLASSLGEIVMQTSTQPFGERAEILIPTRGLASGAYMVTIQQNGRRITKTLSVIH